MHPALCQHMAIHPGGQTLAAAPQRAGTRARLAVCSRGMTGTGGRCIVRRHLNPAVTFAQCLTGHSSWVRGGLYVLAQVLGAIFGALFQV